MILNIVVPFGEIAFVIYDENTKRFFNVKLSKRNYQRLTVKAGLWLAFKGCSQKNMLLNLANVEHDPNESINIELNKIKYNWKLTK